MQHYSFTLFEVVFKVAEIAQLGERQTEGVFNINCENVIC